MSGRTISSAFLVLATGLLLFVAGTILFPSKGATEPKSSVEGKRASVSSPPGKGKTGPKTGSKTQTGPKTQPSSATTEKRPPLPPGPRTVDAVVERFEKIARNRYAAACRRAGMEWPPKRLMLLGFKQEKNLEVWGAEADGPYHHLATHKVLAASGGAGPKRRQGDKQVPEGFYAITELNPNSSYHLSMRVDYPNQEDIRNSRRSVPAMGGDIYIHGDQQSIGCLAIGDRGIEELFTLAALVPEGSRDIIIAPFDFRRRPDAPLPREERWVIDLYGRIRTALRRFPVKGSA